MLWRCNGTGSNDLTNDCPNCKTAMHLSVYECSGCIKCLKCCFSKACTVIPPVDLTDFSLQKVVALPKSDEVVQLLSVADATGCCGRSLLRVDVLSTHSTSKTGGVSISEISLYGVKETVTGFRCGVCDYANGPERWSCARCNSRRLFTADPAIGAVALAAETEAAAAATTRQFSKQAQARWQVYYGKIINLLLRVGFFTSVPLRQGSRRAGWTAILSPLQSSKRFSLQVWAGHVKLSLQVLTIINSPHIYVCVDPEISPVYLFLVLFSNTIWSITGWYILNSLLRKWVVLFHAIVCNPSCISIQLFSVFMAGNLPGVFIHGKTYLLNEMVVIDPDELPFEYGPLPLRRFPLESIQSTVSWSSRRDCSILSNWWHWLKLCCSSYLW